MMVNDSSFNSQAGDETGRSIPTHIAIIMDGNGRWAQARGLSRTEGHRAGVRALRRVVQACGELGVRYLTVYAFSTENWRRPVSEVSALMRLFVEAMESYLPELVERNVRIRYIGDLTRLTRPAQLAMQKAVAETAGNTGLTLTVALNYGGRAEIARAFRRLFDDLESGKITLAEVDDNTVSNYLDTAGIPDPDLVIRPAGEKRLSNFLLWQVAYSEFWFTDKYWPDFDRDDIAAAIADFGRRQRRFGGLGEE